jgi:hypothetical protein
MSSPAAQKAINDALAAGSALLKFISPNNVGLTGSHECGYYLPKSAWKLFTPYPPVKGENKEHPVDITWPDGRVTNSRIKWYGQLTRSEYRLTRFGRDFPWLADNKIGDLLVLIPAGLDRFIAHVLDTDEDIEEVQAALGLQISGTWAVYGTETVAEVPTEDECIEKRFRAFSSLLTDFPGTSAFSEETRRVIAECISSFSAIPPDDKIISLVDSEYRLFRLVERRLCIDQISRQFKTVDDFLQTAATIMNRRKARAGRALENHLEYILQEAKVPFEIRPDIDGKPDIIIPGKRQYDDVSYPTEKLFMVGVKTTCKDRWRQVLNEARRIPDKHLFTMQPGISGAQLEEMKQARLTLIVPRPLHDKYPPESPMEILTLDTFINRIKIKLGTS